MASTTTKSFPIFRDYAANMTADDVLGFFHCRLATAKFFDIDKLATFTPAGIKQYADSKARDFTLVDGTSLTKSDKNTDGISKGGKHLIAISRTGTRSIKMVTGKTTTNKNRKTVTFLFPQFATNLIVSDALGTILPAAKLSNEPSSTEAFPWFISPGGKRYPILKKTAAEGLGDTVVPLSAAQLSDIAAKAAYDAVLEGN